MSNDHVHPIFKPLLDAISGQPPRMARCSCGRTEPSSPSLAFFQDRSEGSALATDHCKCGYTLSAHTVEGMANNVPSNRRTVIEQGKCTGFVPRGAHEFDSYYCGCRGWD